MRLRRGVPVLRRDNGHLQVGLRRPVALDGLTPEEARFLEGLESRGVDVSTRERREFPRIVAALEAAPHLLAGDEAASRFALASVRWRGADGVTLEAARILAVAGARSMSVVDSRRVGPSDPYAASSRSLTRAEALARAVRDAGGDVRWTSSESRATVEVLRCHGGPDLVAARTLLADDVPHLLVVSDEDAVEVGPLVRPGATACAGCVSAHRTDRDPWWPRLALQLGDPRRDASLPAECVAVAGALAARELLALLRDEPREAGVWTVTAGGDATFSPVGAHPACGCGAAGPVGDDEAAERAAFERAGTAQGRAASPATMSSISGP